MTKSEITPQTRVPIGWLWSIIVLLVFIFGGVLNLVRTQDSKEVDQDLVNRELTQAIKANTELINLTRIDLIRELDQKRDKGYTAWGRQSMIPWAADLEERNKEIGLKVPDPNNLKYGSVD